MILKQIKKVNKKTAKNPMPGRKSIFSNREKYGNIN